MELPNLSNLKLPGVNNSNDAQNNDLKPVSQSYKVVECKSKKSTSNGGGYGTGKRKSSIARVWIKPGSGKFSINNSRVTDYFSREQYVSSVYQPFIDTKTDNLFDVMCTVKGGGTTGQCEAIIHGIARALDCISESYHGTLRQNGFLTRDSRVVERKKYGKRKARKSTQFSKR